MFNKIFGRRDVQYYFAGLEEILQKEWSIFERYLRNFYHKKIFLDKTKIVDTDKLKILFDSTKQLIGEEEKEELRLLKLTKAALNQAKRAMNYARPEERSEFLQIRERLNCFVQILQQLEKILKQERQILSREKLDKSQFQNSINEEIKLLTADEFILSAEIRKIIEDAQKDKIPLLP